MFVQVNTSYENLAKASRVYFKSKSLECLNSQCVESRFFYGFKSTAALNVISDKNNCRPIIAYDECNYKCDHCNNGPFNYYVIRF